jgi:predicted TIM-barrel fold metal-dependent hydrolase
MWTRRDVLQFGIATSLGPFAATTISRATDDAAPAGVVDTHTHFYDPARPEGVPWPGKDDAFLYRTVLPDDYRTLALPLGVTGTVVVEASPWVEDNQWILDLAANDRYLLGLVGNLAPGSPEFAKHFVRFARNRLFLGIRIGSGSLSKGLSDPAFLADIERLALAGLELDVNGGPELLPLVDGLAAKFPDLRIVVNHLANVRIDGNAPPTEWAEGMQAAAKHPHVFCKVSALVEGASQPNRMSSTDVSFYRPVLDHAWKTFGEDRLIYGSNWPVSERYGNLAAVQRIVADYLADCNDAVRAKVFARNAKAAYRWLER